MSRNDRFVATRPGDFWESPAGERLGDLDFNQELYFVMGSESLAPFPTSLDQESLMVATMQANGVNVQYPDNFLSWVPLFSPVPHYIVVTARYTGYCELCDPTLFPTVQDVRLMTSQERTDTFFEDVLLNKRITAGPVSSKFDILTTPFEDQVWDADGPHVYVNKQPDDWGEERPGIYLIDRVISWVSDVRRARRAGAVTNESIVNRSLGWGGRWVWDGDFSGNLPGEPFDLRYRYDFCYRNVNRGDNLPHLDGETRPDVKHEQRLRYRLMQFFRQVPAWRPPIYVDLHDPIPT